MRTVLLFCLCELSAGFTQPVSFIRTKRSATIVQRATVVEERRRFIPIVEEFASDARIQKAVVWVGFFGAMRLLQPFYSVIFMTFLFTFIGAQFVDFAQAWTARLTRRKRRQPDREEDAGKTWARSVLQRIDRATQSPVSWVPPRKFFAAIYVASVVTAGAYATLRFGPIVARESKYVTSQLTDADPYFAAAEAVRSLLGDQRAAQLEDVARSIVDSKDFFGSPHHSTVSTAQLSETMRRLASPHFYRLGQAFSSLLKPVPSLLYDVATAFLFSFMLVWDLPAFAASLASLGSKARRRWIRFTYNEVSPKVRSFAKLLGTNFEIQGLVAIVNTVLTTAGLMLLDISGTRFLALLVFVCSFVPVIGVFVSTIPACFLALAEHGTRRLAQVVVMVLAVHFVEAYLIYPQVYATKLKVHPLVVLVALFIFEHAVGWQGLFVAVPVSVFLGQVLLGDRTTAPSSSSTDNDGGETGTLAAESDAPTRPLPTPPISS